MVRGFFHGITYATYKVTLGVPDKSIPTATIAPFRHPRLLNLTLKRTIYELFYARRRI